MFSGDCDLLLGRRTYDIFAAYWPYAEGDEKPMGEAFDRANKYVLTRGEHPLEWQNSHRLAGVDEVASLKEGNGADMIIQGSSTIYPVLLAAGLIDTLITMTYPVLLGRGKRLFGEGTPAGSLEMTDHRVTDKGTVVATYRLGKALPPYPDQGPIPVTSERERTQRALMEAGKW